jgi:2-C-methyl-D-erythritol 2,4-cyclodiphosphate synthase
MSNLRIGQGVDFHRLAEGRDLWLGGVLVPHTKGALGHSDADVLLHAICDALLGAACLGDIGTHFPDTSQEFKNIDSKILLQRTIDLLEQHVYTVINIDCMLCLQAPKIKSYIPQMQEIIAHILKVEKDAVSVKATTAEGLGFVGREEGVMAYATVLIEKNKLLF